MTEVMIPDGYRQDAKGRLVHESKISDFQHAREEFVLEWFDKAIALNAEMSAFKKALQIDLDAFVQLSAERFGENVQGAKGGFSLPSFDGRYKVQVAVQDLTHFDEGVMVAQKLLLEVAEQWQDELAEVEGVAGAEDMAQAIHYAFEADRQGKLSQTRVRSLRNWKIKHPKWQKAMTIIDDSLQTIGERSYVRFYKRRGESGNKYDLIPMDLAGV